MTEPIETVEPSVAARLGARIRDLSRAEGWWEFKAGPILAMAYAAAWIEWIPLHEHVPTLIGIVVSLTALAAAANVLNDYTDLADDAAAGKSNRLAGRPPWFAPAVLAGLASVGAATVAAMPIDARARGWYAANALAFVLYSVPPARLKIRGYLGILADAAGAHVLPGLYAVYALAASADVIPGPGIVALLAIGALAYGLRGILWHQLTDYENDAKTGGHTFVCRVGTERAIAFGEQVVFPIEIGALAFLVVVMGHPLPLLAIAAELFLVYLRRRYHLVTSIVVAPRERFRILLHELHFAVMPLVILLMLTIRDPWDGTILLAHFVLFSSRFRLWAIDLYQLGRRELDERRARTRAP